MTDWPQFVSLQPLDGTRTWTAIFDSYDPYHECCYYRARLFDGEQKTAQLIAKIETSLAGDDGSGPAFVDQLRAGIAGVVATGETNTEYDGYGDVWTPTDLESFRAAHPFPADAIARCDRPDWALRLVFDASSDRKSTISTGVMLAIGLRWDFVNTLAFLTPWPLQLEALQMWADGGDDWTPETDRVRARVTGGFLGVCLTSLVVWLLGIAADHQVLAITLGSLIPSFLLTQLVKLVWAKGMRQKVGHLDDVSALKIVVDRIAKGVEKDPSSVPMMMYFIHRQFRGVGGAESTWPDLWLGYRLGRRRKWTARFDSHDPARDVCYYRVLVFQGKRRAGDLFAEVATEFVRGDWTTAMRKELTDRLAKIAATGASNTSYRGRPS